MQIDSIELFHLALPLRRPVELPCGPAEALETVLVRVQSGDAAGWGEAAPGNAPLSSHEWAAGAFACLKDYLAPAVAAAAIGSGDELAERLKPFRGNRYAKAALDMAWWDLSARLQEKPLHQLLGGTRDRVEVGPTFDQMDSIDEFLAAIGRAFEAGFARVRLMLRPGWDIQMVDAVRKEFATEAIHVDVEAELKLEQLEILQRLDDFGLEMYEQPLPADDLIGHAMAQESISTPICLHESISSVDQAEMALELKSCKYMNIEPGRVGGLTPAVAIHDLCRNENARCFVGAMPQSAVGRRIGLALAAKEHFSYPADYFPAAEALEADLAEPLPPKRQKDGGTLQIPLWSEPGIGIEPNVQTLKEFSIAKTRVV